MQSLLSAARALDPFGGLARRYQRRVHAPDTVHASDDLATRPADGHMNAIECEIVGADETGLGALLLDAGHVHGQDASLGPLWCVQRGTAFYFRRGVLLSNAAGDFGTRVCLF